MKLINIETNKPPSLKDFKSLIMDPFCIRSRMLPQITTYIKNNVRERLPAICHNPEITKMLSLDNNKSIDSIVEILNTMNPFFVTFAHEILRNSNAGLVEQFQTRLTNIQTINKIVQIMSHEEDNIDDQMFMIEQRTSLDDYGQIQGLSKELDFITTSYIYTNKIVKELDKRVKTPVEYEGTKFYKLIVENNCSRKIADDLRFIHWGKECIGVSRPVPMVQCILKNVDDITPTERGRSIMLYTADSLREQTSNKLLDIGKYPPYYGSETREKVDRPRMTVIHPSGLTTSLKKLVLLRSWTIILKSENLTNFIDIHTYK